MTLGVARYNEMLIAQMNKEKESTEYRSRTTRLAKWKDLVTQAQLDLELQAGIPERIQQLESRWILSLTM